MYGAVTDYYIYKSYNIILCSFFAITRRSNGKVPYPHPPIIILKAKYYEDDFLAHIAFRLGYQVK